MSKTTNIFVRVELAFEDLTPEEFKNEIEKGFNDLRAGRVVSV